MADKSGARVTVDPRGASGVSSLCWKHDSPLDRYCCTDRRLICARCAATEHRGHRFGSVREERRRKQSELEKTQTTSRRILQEQKKKWKNLKEVLEQIQEEGGQTEEYCQSVLVSVMAVLQKHYLTLTEIIAAQVDTAASQLTDSVRKMEARMKEMETREAQLNRLALTDSDVFFLQEWPSLQGLCEEDHLHCASDVSEDPLLPFELTKRSVAELGRKLEELSDKEFSVFSESGDPLTQHNQEPTTRAEFLKYACDLTLDPATAHKDLVVSAGDKEVTMRPPLQISRSSATIPHPQRFIHRHNVLCREALQADHCYYEIEVQGDKAEIGLAYKAMDRKSRTETSAFGGNASSWSLDRSLDFYSVSHKSDSVQLTKCPKCPRIGVYLNFREGTLSFYEVTNSMTFLYKVEAQFTEPLYPGFWLGDKCCIRICDLSRDRV